MPPGPRSGHQRIGRLRPDGDRVNQLIMLLQEYGLGLVFVNVLALQAGLPVPAYPVLIVAGAYAAMGGNPLWELVAIAVAAALVADTGWYLAGRRFGLSILRTLC